MEQRELIILGAGPAGLTAAIYARRAGLDTLLLEKANPGGQILVTYEIENWPGIIHSSGEALAASFKAHAEHLKAEIRTATVTELEPLADHEGVIVHTEDGPLQAKAVIIATGAYFRKLGCPGEMTMLGRGVSYCAICDGAFFDGLTVAVVGGGNTAVEEAAYLTQFAEKVYLIHRRDKLRADHIVAEKALNNPKIEPVWDSVVESIDGKDMVEGVTIKNVKSGETSEIAVDGVFVFVGTLPHADFVKDVVERDEDGWIIADEDMHTSHPAIFAAGDVRNTSLRQVVTAAADGARAALSAFAHIKH